MVHKRKPMPGGLKDSPPHWILRELRTRIHWVIEVLELCNQFATHQKRVPAALRHWHPIDLLDF